jgi:hypothetical protein
MAKYKLLIEASQYSYKTVSAPELTGGDGTKEIKDKLLYTIPKGTIIEAEPLKFNGGENEDFPNSFQISLKKDTDKYPVYLGNIRDVKNNSYFKKELELVPDDSKVTLDKSVKVINSEQHGLGADYPDNTDVAPQTFLQKHKNHLLIAGALVIGYLAYKKFNK